MSPIVTQLLYTIETAMLFSIVTIGLYISFRILRFPDLTAEGGFGLSAIVGGMVVLATGSPFLGLIAGISTGICTGAVTAFLANFIKLPTILASILTMTMCFSTGLLLAGQPSLSFSGEWILTSIVRFSWSPLFIGLLGGGIGLVLVVVFLLSFLRTGGGFLLRVRGENPNLLRELKHNLITWDIIGLGIANGVVGLAAVLLSQRSGYASINMGRGIAISAIAAIMLGEAIFPSHKLSAAFLACIAGTLILQLVRLLALNLGVPDGGLDLVTSLLVIAFCWIANKRGQDGLLLEQIRM